MNSSPKKRDFTDNTEISMVICGSSLTSGQEIVISITVRREDDIEKAENEIKEHLKSYRAAGMLIGCRISYREENDEMEEGGLCLD